MDVIDELIANNAAFAASLPVAHLDVRPRRRLAIVTCMDSRLDVFAALGLHHGEAHILRNAGGVITDDVIRSLAVSQRRLLTREVMLVHHTDCGMQKLTDDGFRAELQEAGGVAPAFVIESFSDLDGDVRQSILRVRRSPFLLHRELIRGFVSRPSSIVTSIAPRLPQPPAAICGGAPAGVRLLSRRGKVDGLQTRKGRA